MIWRLTLLVFVGTLACRTKDQQNQVSTTLDTSTASTVIVAVKDSGTAQAIFSQLKKWDHAKSSPSLRVYEGPGSLLCADVDGMQCSMTTGVARDYIFNVSDLEADLINDLWGATPVVGAGIVSKNVAGLMRLTSTKTEFKIELLGPLPPQHLVLDVKNYDFARDIFKRLKKWDETQSTATSKVFTGLVDLECQARPKETQCWMKASTGYVFSFNDETAEILDEAWAIKPEVSGEAKIKRAKLFIRMVSTANEFLIFEEKK